jgi:hypothetical protein
MGWGDQPKWDKKNMMVPFDSKGNLATYTYGNVSWVRVFEFKSTMKIVDYGNTTGSAVFELEDEKGFVYPIYVAEFLKVLQTRNITNGVIEETLWTYKKQGRQYSIKLFEE